MNSVKDRLKYIWQFILSVRLWHIQAAEKRSRHIRFYPNTRRFIALAENMRPWMELFTLAWFVFGNYLVFGSSNCAHNAPRLYFGTLLFILVDYFLMAVFISVYISAVVCLPHVVATLQNMGFMNIDKKANREKRKEAIDHLPVYQYKQTLELFQPHNNVHRKKELKSSLYFSTDIESEGYGAITLEDNAICCICLLCYQENDLLCKLWYVSEAVPGEENNFARFLIFLSLGAIIISISCA
ncbi:hypothetical protein BY458DRAFT_499575 [Sporodiniella umbellata]|nr:hypothetical protein BY458DRAFT_499575 [Sporodiniella umbellata]